MTRPFSRRRGVPPFGIRRSHPNGLEEIPDLVRDELEPGEVAPTFISMDEAVRRSLATCPPFLGLCDGQMQGGDDDQ